jgi:hypothetical protein
MYDAAAHHRLLPRIPRYGATPQVDQCRTEQCELATSELIPIR